MLVNILEPDDYSKTAISTYKKLGEIITGECQAERKSAVNILVVRLSHQLDAAYLTPYSELVAIASPTTGLNHIDIDYCQARNIQIYSLQQRRSAIDEVTSTSELTFGLMLSLLRKIPAAHHHVVHQHQWNRDAFKSRQLSERILGLIGIGRIGSHMAAYAQAFGMRIIAYDPHVDESRFSQLGVERVDLESLCQRSDIISVHASQRDDNRHLIGDREIRWMRRDTLLINTARGSLIDEKAAADALREYRLGGVACDVLEHEIEQDVLFPGCSHLCQAADAGFNAILTPHIGGCTKDAMQITEDIIADYVYSELSKGHG